MATTRRKDTQPIPPALWMTLFVCGAAAAWWVKLPAMPIILLGLIVAGATAQYPTPAKRSDPPDEKKLATFRFWKNVLAGFSPVKDKWWKPIRGSWWMGWLLGLIQPVANPLFLLANIPCAFIATMMWCHAWDRRKDVLHPYTGVSVGAFLKNATPWKRITVSIACGVLLVGAFCLCYLEYANWNLLLFPPILFLFLAWIMDRKRQSGQWRQLVEWQTTLNSWVNAEDSPMQKAWRNLRVSQVNTFGDQDNALTVIRVRMDRGVTDALKADVEAVLPLATENGYNFVALLAAKQKKQGHDMFDPNCLRLVLGRDESCIPDIRLKSAGERIATLVADIAYARTAHDWHKPAPLCEAHDVSAEEGENARAAWLLTFTMPPTGGDIQRISIDWLDTDGDPSTIIRLPAFSDIFYKFHLYAEEDVPLDDKGNKWRPQGVTGKKPFADYIATSRRFKREQATWEEIIHNSQFPLPSPNYDGERIYPCNGWRVVALPLELHTPVTPSDIARLKLAPLDPTARFIGVIANGANAVLISTYGMRAPERVDQLDGRTPECRMLAEAILMKALLDVTLRSGQVSVSQCTNEGNGVPIWHAVVTVGAGATIQDLRRKSANIQSGAGAAKLFWNWTDPSMAQIWITGEDSYLTLEDLDRWNNKRRQKELIQLALSEAWGRAGITDPAGQAPVVRQLGVLPNNQSVLNVEFEMPGGLTLTRIDAATDKFLTASGYGYGRRINGDSEEPTVFDMILARKSPFPTMVNADWQLASQGNGLKFPLGVNDLGDPVYWEVKGTPHIAIMGKTGTGKSSAMQVAVCDALLHDYQLIIIDPTKGAVDFDSWARPKSLAFVGLGQMRETEAVITWAEKEMNRRSQINKLYGVGNILDLPDDVRPRRLVIAFDEFNNYISNMGKTAPNPNNDLTIANDNARINGTNNSIRRAVGALSRIALAGRSLGISIILGAQRISTKDMEQFTGGTQFWRSTGRILLGADSTMGVISATNVSPANRLQAQLKGTGGLIPQGRGIYESAQGQLTALQTWWSGDQAKLAQVVADLPDAEPIDFSQYMPKQAATYGEVSEEEIQQIKQEAANDDLTITQEDLDNAEEVDW